MGWSSGWRLSASAIGRAKCFLLSISLERWRPPRVQPHLAGQIRRRELVSLSPPSTRGREFGQSSRRRSAGRVSRRPPDSSHSEECPRSSAAPKGPEGVPTVLSPLDRTAAPPPSQDLVFHAVATQARWYLRYRRSRRVPGRQSRRSRLGTSAPRICDVAAILRTLDAGPQVRPRCAGLRPDI